MAQIPKHQKVSFVAQPESVVIEEVKVISPASSSNAPQAVSASPEPTRGDKHYKMLVTAYCSCQKCCGKTPGHPGYGITASGVKASKITAAADWNIFPKGTRLYIEGVGYRVVQDRGGAIAGNRLDIWMESHEAALKFGRKTLAVRVVE